MSQIDDAEIHWLILDGLEVLGDSGQHEWSFTLFLQNPARKERASKTASVIDSDFFIFLLRCDSDQIRGEIRSFSIWIWDPLPYVIAASSED